MSTDLAKMKHTVPNSVELLTLPRRQVYAEHVGLPWSGDERFTHYS